MTKNEAKPTHPHATTELCEEGRRLYGNALRTGRVARADVEPAPCLMEFALLHADPDDPNWLRPVPPSIALSQLLNPIERVINEVLEQQIAALGEPWLSTFDPAQLRSQLLELGFSSAESATPDDLNARYFARRKDGLRTGGGVHIMRANK